jgi:hypothetical protein
MELSSILIKGIRLYLEPINIDNGAVDITRLS